MCQSHQYVIGGDPGDEAIWIDTDGTPYAYYEKSSKGTRVGYVHLLCDQSVSYDDTRFIFAGELSSFHYVSSEQTL